MLVSFRHLKNKIGLCSKHSLGSLNKLLCFEYLGDKVLLKFTDRVVPTILYHYSILRYVTCITIQHISPQKFKAKHFIEFKDKQREICMNNVRTQFLWFKFF